MEKSFNVAYEPWIPVVDLAGVRRLVSLAQVFSSGREIADLQVRPQERVALMRLFACVAHAALDGPKDYDAWETVPKVLPDAAQKYLKKWEDSFWVFHPEKPWLQTPDIDKGKGACPVDSANRDDWTPVSKLNFSYSSGNNSTLFDHVALRADREISLEETALSMLTYQCYSAGGLSAQVFWHGKQTNKSAKDSPCITASMLHAFIRGKNLLESIHLNLPTQEMVKAHYGNSLFGRPVWEKIPKSFDDKVGVENATRTYAGRLVPLKRFMKLHASARGILLGEGLDYPAFVDGFPPEPTATVVLSSGGAEKKKDSRSYLSYRPNKAVWRELTALLLKRENQEDGRCLVLRNMAEGNDFDLVVVGVARDQAEILDHTESVFHITPGLFGPVGALLYETEVLFAESIARKLSWAVQEYRKELDGGWEGKLKAAGSSKGDLIRKLESTAATLYWTAVEKNLDILMAYIDVLGTDAAPGARSRWQKLVKQAARESFQSVCGQETPRQIRAFAKGLDRLVHKAPEKTEKPTMQEEVE